MKRMKTRYSHPCRSGIFSCFALLAFFLASLSVKGQQKEEIRVGILTDCQYCNCPPLGIRYYALSLAKLDSCITVFNALPLSSVFHLGDMIDRNISSLDSVLPRFQKFKAPVHLILGNHEYMLGKDFQPELLRRTGQKDLFYTYDLGSWRFIILDGNDLSFLASQTKEQRKERNRIVLDQYQQLQFTGMPWNGGIGRMQMNWLEQKLKEADTGNKNVIVMCHFPLVGRQTHILFNHSEVLALLTKHHSVKAYFCGHIHNGGYMEYNGIHLVNFQGMVNTKINAFSVVTLLPDSILIRGYGREPSRGLKIRK